MNKEINLIKKEYKLFADIVCGDAVEYLKNELYYNFNENEINLMVNKLNIEGNILFINSLHVEDKFKGMGYGKNAIKKVMDSAKMDCYLICDKTLNEKGRNTNKKFYLKNNFEIIYENNDFSLMKKKYSKNKIKYQF